MRPDIMKEIFNEPKQKESVPALFKYLLIALVVFAYLCLVLIFFFPQEQKDICEDVICDETAIATTVFRDENNIIIESDLKYIPYDVPQINSSFKAYMDYRKITSKSSDQYKFIEQHAWVDGEGFMRCNRDTGVENDYYLIALGSYYGTEIGTKYRITTDNGNVFYGVLGDCKDDKHTNLTNQYTVVGNDNVIEFLVDTRVLNKDVKYHGTAEKLEVLSGNIISIERIEF